MPRDVVQKRTYGQIFDGQSGLDHSSYRDHHQSQGGRGANGYPPPFQAAFSTYEEHFPPDLRSHYAYNGTQAFQGLAYNNQRIQPGSTNASRNGYNPTAFRGRTNTSTYRGRRPAPSGTFNAARVNAPQPDRKNRGAAYKPGMIVSSVHFAALMDKNSKSRAFTWLGDVSAKLRFMIILCKFADHFLALPMYTHNNSGLEGKPLDKQPEYIGIKYPNNDGYRNECNYDPLVVEGQCDFELKDKSLVWVTEAIPIYYSADHTEVRGRIAKESHRRLLHLYQKLVYNNAGIEAPPRIFPARPTPTAALFSATNSNEQREYPSGTVDAKIITTEAHRVSGLPTPDTTPMLQSKYKTYAESLTRYAR